MTVQTDAMRRVDNNGKMSLGLQDWHCVQVERIARHRLESPDAALTKQHVEVAFVENVFGTHQKVLDRRRKSPLQHHWKFASANLLEQREILHVASADLEAICVFLDFFEVLCIHYLGDHGKPGFLAGFREQLEPFDSKTLKGIRRSSGLECATPKNSCTGPLHVPCDGNNLVPAFDGAWARHENDLTVADRDVPDFDERLGLTEFVGNKLVGFKDRCNGFNPGYGRNRLFSDDIFGTDDPNDNSFGASADFRFEPPFFDPFHDVIDLIFGGSGLGYYDHKAGIGGKERSVGSREGNPFLNAFGARPLPGFDRRSKDDLASGAFVRSRMHASHRDTQVFEDSPSEKSRCVRSLNTLQSRMMQRILGIDHGEARVGLALSDELGVFAHPLETVEVKKIEPVGRIAEIVKRENVALLLLGMPRNMDGSYGPAAEKVKDFAEILRKKTGLEIKFWDERMTSLAAQRVLRDAGRKMKDGRKIIDQVAAQMILQSYLDSLGT
jgi:putative Holliday junction resolvase